MSCLNIFREIQPPTVFAADRLSDGPDKIWIAIALTPEMPGVTEHHRTGTQVPHGHMAVGSTFNTLWFVSPPRAAAAAAAARVAGFRRPLVLLAPSES